MIASIDWNHPLVFVNVLFVIGFALSGIPLFVRRPGGARARLVPIYRGPALLMMIAHCTLLILSRDSRPVQGLAVLCGISALVLLSAELRALREPTQARQIAILGVGALAGITILLGIHGYVSPERYFDRVMVGLIIGASACWLIFNEASNITDPAFRRYRTPICALAIAVMYLMLFRIYFSIQHSDQVLIQPYHEPMKVLWVRLGVGGGVLMIVGLLNAFYLQWLLFQGRGAKPGADSGERQDDIRNSPRIILR
jgi:hypothetical protein